MRVKCITPVASVSSARAGSGTSERAGSGPTKYPAIRFQPRLRGSLFDPFLYNNRPEYSKEFF